jgi:hypothetical protein
MFARSSEAPHSHRWPCTAARRSERFQQPAAQLLTLVPRGSKFQVPGAGFLSLLRDAFSKHPDPRHRGSSRRHRSDPGTTVQIGINSCTGPGAGVTPSTGYS